MLYTDSQLLRSRNGLVYEEASKRFLSFLFKYITKSYHSFLFLLIARRDLLYIYHIKRLHGTIVYSIHRFLLHCTLERRIPSQ
jgi:hypothetical protein